MRKWTRVARPRRQEPPRWSAGDVRLVIAGVLAAVLLGLGIYVFRHI